MKTKRVKWVWLVAAPVTVGAVVLLLLILGGAFHSKVDAAGTPGAVRGRPGPAQPSVEVEVRDVASGEWAVGTVRAVHETTLGARLLATVVRVHAEAGKDVQRGDILIELDDRDLRARLEKATARAEAARATSDQARAEYQRLVPLAEDGSASAFELTTASNALRVAEAEHARAVEDRREAETILTYAVIRSPVDGRVVDKLVDSGDIVTPGQPMVTLYDPTRMQLVATVRESLRQRLEIGQQVEVKLDLPEYICRAAVSEIVPRAESASRSFEVKVTGPCPPGVYPGMFGRLRVPLESRQAICVPVSAIRRVGQLDLVQVLEGDDVRRRLVRLGQAVAKDTVEVLSGLRAGERVLLTEAVPVSGEVGHGG